MPLFFALVCWVSWTGVWAQESLSHPLRAPYEAGFSFTGLLQLEATLERQMHDQAFPGAALAIGRAEAVVVERGLGFERWEDGVAPIDPHHSVFDLASLTKVVATTSAIMLLVEEGRLRLSDPVRRYLPSFSAQWEGREALVTIEHLLTHTSGLPDWIDLGGLSPERARAKVYSAALKAAPGSRVKYSDIGFVLLWDLAERVVGGNLERYLAQRLFQPLGMTQTRFAHGTPCPTCVPTARLPDGSLYRGTVHDPIARRLGGISGNAGLFSTLHDLTRFAAMMANEGELEGVRLFQAETVRQFTRRVPGAESRALGWDTGIQDGQRGASGSLMPLVSYGHTGYTGTSLWIDPSSRAWIVVLTNRTYHPKGPNRMQAIRRALHDQLMESLLRRE